jgi:hypothetical protein
MEHAQTFALIQTLVNKEKATEAFESYKKIRFPWIESSNEKQKADHLKRMMDEVKHGALSITPMAQTKKVNSRLRRVIDNQSRDTQTTPQEQKKIYAKMGQAIPR